MANNDDLVISNSYALDVIPNWHTSAVAATGTHRTERARGTVTEIYPPSYWPGDSSGDHLEFALKYDGTNLGILVAVFSAAEPSEIVSYIESKPLGKYTRRIWILYEFLKDKRLPLDDLSRGNYVDLLDADHHYVVIPPTQVRRQRVNNNLPGGPQLLPRRPANGDASEF